MTADCASCGGQFQLSNRKNVSRVCSPACRTNLYYASQSEAERRERLRRNQERQRRKRDLARKARPICPSCGQTKSSRGGTYCSRTPKCRSLARSEYPTCTKPGCEKPIQARGLCGSCYATWHRNQMKYTITCGHCGKTVQVDRPSRKHCSRACAAAVGIQASILVCKKPRPLMLYTGPAWVRPKPPEAWVRTARRLTSGQCRVCNTWFVSTDTGITCSPECFDTYHAEQKRLAKDRRRARTRDAFVENVYRKQVFERDGYRCHLCRKKTNPAKQVPHPRAPTIDHLIPLACGGTHEPANCRTACFLCNALKGDRGGGEQLLLMA